MVLKKLINAFCRIRDAIWRTLGCVQKVDNTCEESNSASGNQTEENPETGMPAPDTSSVTEAVDEAKTETEDKVKVAIEDETRTETEDKAKVETGKPPQNRSGRRGTRQPTPPTERKPLTTDKPVLLCREETAHRQWQILLSLPQGRADVFQGESRLSSDNRGEYPLSSFTDEVAVRWVESKKDEKISLVDGANPLIFKLGKNWKGCGREVRHVSDGYYVVFSPRDWNRTGTAPVEPSACNDNRFWLFPKCSG